MVTYGVSDFRRLHFWSQTDTYGPVWIAMVIYGYSDFFRLLTVAYGYIRTHTDEYGHLWAP